MKFRRRIREPPPGPDALVRDNDVEEFNMIVRCPRFLPASLAVLLPMPGAPARCTTLLTVHNRTGKILMVSPPGSPWHPEPDDPPGLAVSRRWLGPGSVGTYRFTSPGKVVETDVVIRSLHLDGRVECEGFMIQAVDPDLDPPCAEPRIWPQEADPKDKFIGDEPPPDPEGATIVRDGLGSGVVLFRPIWRIEFLALPQDVDGNRYRDHRPGKQRQFHEGIPEVLDRG
jgi:hypothetical protein